MGHRHSRATLLAFLTVLAACRPQEPRPTPDSGLEAARAALAAGEHERALTLLETARAAADSEELVSLTAKAQARSGDMPAAMKTLRQGAESFPHSFELRLLTAEVMNEVGRSAWAIDELRAARELGAPDERTALALAIAHGRVGEIDAAESELDRAEAAGAVGSVVVYNRAQIAIQRGERAKARELLEQLLAAEPTHAPALRELARIELADAAEGDRSALARAQTHVNRALDVDGEDWRSYELLGDLFRADDDWAAAKQAYIEAMRFGLNPPHLDDKYRDVEAKLRELGLSEG